MDRARAIELLEQLHDAQNEYYGGGHHTLLRQILATDIVWTVPGASRIAGTYRGLDEVSAYFRQRRASPAGPSGCTDATSSSATLNASQR